MSRYARGLPLKRNINIHEGATGQRFSRRRDGSHHWNSTSVTFAVGGSITASSTVSASAAIASVSATYGATITATKSGTATTSVSWRVPASYQLGRLSIGAFKYSGLTTRYLENSACTLVKQGSSATYIDPRNEWAFITQKVS